jgi:hypothetical protein
MCSWTHLPQDTHGKRVRSMIVCMQKCGYGRDITCSPWLPLTPKKRKRFLRILSSGFNTCPGR